MSLTFIGQCENPIFGVPLAVAVERNKSHDGIEVPVIVRECIDYIEECGEILFILIKDINKPIRVLIIRKYFNNSILDLYSLMNYKK